LQEDKYFNAWNQSFVEQTQMDQTHLDSNEYVVPKDDREQAVLQKIQFLYAVLEEHLNTDHMKSLAHPYGKDFDIAYFELKKHALAFTMEQLSRDVMIQYRMLPIKHLGK
jgi:uncharacterized protein YprB with RNaseH-like and TPR domain